MNNFLQQYNKTQKNKYARMGDEGIVGSEFGYIDSGSYTFNALLSGSIFGGYQDNKVTMNAGLPSTGKSFLFYDMMKHFLNRHPDNGVILWESEGALTDEILKSRDIDPSRVNIRPVNTVQDFGSELINFINSYEKVFGIDHEPRILLGVDSIGNLSTLKTVADMEKGDDKVDMTAAKLLRAVFKANTLRLNAVGVPMYMVNHVWTETGPFAKVKTSGGEGPVYAASSINFLTKAKDKEGQGAIITATAKKSRFVKEHTQVKMMLNYKSGLDRYYGLLELAKDANVWKEASGGRFEMEDGSKVFGKHIKEEPKKYFTQEVLEKIDDYVKSTFKLGTDMKPVSIENIESVEDE